MLELDLAAQNLSAPARESKLFFIHKNDSIKTLKDFFILGHAQGHIRNFTMATIHEGELQDYWTNATGGALKYETAEWYGLSLGVKGIFTYNTISSDLNEIDPLTGRSAIWEKELYDVLRPEEKYDLDRLEELYVKWRVGRSYLAYGKLDIDQGPLLKRRDGRMKPFVYRGFWSEFNEFEGHRLRLGWIDGVSPRGMTEWFDMNDAIGINGNGRQPDGTAADYHGSSGIKGIGVIGYENSQTENLKLNIWNYYFDRQSDISWLQADYKKENVIAGFQYVHQRSLSTQSSLSYEERYMQSDETANVLSVLLGFQNNKSGVEISAAYLKAFDTGRFLFPRELGREDFYVSQPRSWVDGFGDTDIYSLRFRFRKDIKYHGSWNIDTRIAKIDAPAPAEAQFNKYGIPSYYQLSLFPRYTFSNLLDGLDVGLLYVWKMSQGGLDLSPQQQFYRTDLHNLNLIANINF